MHHNRRVGGVTPTVHRLSACRIVIYADDHNPPHFHIKGAGCSYVVDIVTLSVTRGRPPGSVDEALRWAAAHRDLLLEKWTSFNERDL